MSTHDRGFTKWAMVVMKQDHFSFNLQTVYSLCGVSIVMGRERKREKEREKEREKREKREKKANREKTDFSVGLARVTVGDATRQMPFRSSKVFPPTTRAFAHWARETKKDSPRPRQMLYNYFYSHNY
eukprot:scaffold6807_cov220-Amphora_coffeaeformis.AAC.7